MTGAESDVATLVRLKIARDATLAARRSWEDRRFWLVTSNRLLSTARSRWPAYMALTRALAADYQRRSKDLGIRVEIEELIRLRAWLPELTIHIARDDRELATRLHFRMASNGRTFCKIQQTRGWRQANLNRDDRPIEISEWNLRPLLRTIVQILIVH